MLLSSLRRRLTQQPAAEYPAAVVIDLERESERAQPYPLADGVEVVSPLALPFNM